MDIPLTSVTSWLLSASNSKELNGRSLTGMWTDNKTNESPCHRGNINPLRPSHSTTVSDRNTSLDHTGGISELVFVQYIKIFQSFFA